MQSHCPKRNDYMCIQCNKKFGKLSNAKRHMELFCPKRNMPATMTMGSQSENWKSAMPIPMVMPVAAPRYGMNEINPAPRPTSNPDFNPTSVSPTQYITASSRQTVACPRMKEASVLSISRNCSRT